MKHKILIFSLAFLSVYSPSAVGAETIRVMAWNLMDMDLFDGEGTERVAWQIEAEAGIADVLRVIDPDIVFVAEAPSYVELDSFIRAYDLDYRVSHVRQQSGRRDFADGLALLTREEPSYAELVTPPVPGSDRNEATRYIDWSYRGLLSAKIGELTVVGVHLKSPWDGKRRSYELRNNQIGGLLEYLEDRDGPVLILGDFNDSPGTDAKEEEFGVPDSIGRLREVFSWAEGDDVTQESGLNLDHIFVRGASVGPRNVVETDWILSDHHPVWADIEY